MLRSIFIGLVIVLVILAGGLSYVYQTFTTAEITEPIQPELDEPENTTDEVLEQSSLVNKPSSINEINSDVLPISSNKTSPKETIPGQPLAQIKNETSTGTGPESVGVVSWTNVKRLENGLQPVTSDSALSEVAEFKLNDLISQNYFAHVSPSGAGIGDLASQFSYSYSIIGENLAYGDFANSRELVQAWFDSPGHRENILNANFSKIGVAVRKASFQGGNYFVAVQVFASPARICPVPDDRLKSEIQSKTAEVRNLNFEMQELEPTLESQSDYNAYNEMVSTHNNLVHIIEALVVEYNLQVKKYNNCVSG